MSKCEDIRDLISLYIDNELNENERMEFENHINQCSSCQYELDEIRKTIELCSTLEEAELPEKFSEKLHQRLLQEKTLFERNKAVVLRNRYIKICASIAAGIMLVIVAGSFWGGMFLKNSFDLTSSTKQSSISEKAEDQKADNQDSIKNYNRSAAGKAEDSIAEDAAGNSSTKSAPAGGSSSASAALSDQVKKDSSETESAKASEPAKAKIAPKFDKVEANNTANEKKTADEPVQAEATQAAIPQEKVINKKAAHEDVTQDAQDAPQGIAASSIMSAAAPEPAVWNNNINFTIIAPNPGTAVEEITNIARENGAGLNNTPVTAQAGIMAVTDTVLSFRIQESKYGAFIEELKAKYGEQVPDITRVNKIDVTETIQQLNIEISKDNEKIDQLEKAGQASNPQELEQLKEEKKSLEERVDTLKEDQGYILCIITVKCQ